MCLHRMAQQILFKKSLDLNQLYIFLILLLIHSHYYGKMAPPTYTLYTPPGSFRAFAPLIAAEYNGINVTVETSDIENVAKTKSPTGKAPLLETPRGDIIFSSHAIARYIVSLRTDTELMGSTFQEKAAINNWIDWTSAQVELPACILFYPVAGFMPENEQAYVLISIQYYWTVWILSNGKYGVMMCLVP